MRRGASDTIVVNNNDKEADDNIYWFWARNYVAVCGYVYGVNIIERTGVVENCIAKKIHPGAMPSAPLFLFAGSAHIIINSTPPSWPRPIRPPTDSAAENIGSPPADAAPTEFPTVSAHHFGPRPRAMNLDEHQNACEF